MGRVRRFDAGELAPPVRSPSGYLIAEGRISRVGIQEYSDSSGRVLRELRIPEEVFSLESIASFRSVPITNTHPPELVTPDNSKAYTVGALEHQPAQDGDWLKGSLVIYDGEAIAAAQAGRSELSCGYTCTLDPTQVPELVQKWGAYDFIQREIRGNHVALVDEARAGHEARLRLDSGDAAVIRLVRPRATSTESHMPPQIKIDGFHIDATEGNAGTIQQAIDKAIAAAKERADAAVSGERVKLDAAEKKLRIVKDNALGLLRDKAALRAHLDAMKARMIDCDECGGTGKVTDEQGAEKACDYCDGAGKFRMHSKLADVIEPATEEEPIEEGVDDETELEVEQETETEASKAHKDRKRADARKRRADDAAAARKARSDSYARRLRRATAARVELLDQARKHLGPDAELAKLDEVGIKRAVVEKLCPGAKLDGKSADQVRARYDAELERLAEAPNGADAARASTAGPTAGAARHDGNELPDPDAARAGMLKRNSETGAKK